MGLAFRRLARQRLSQHPLQSPEQVVAWLGAVQAQDYPGAKWALGLRTQPGTREATDQAIEQAFNEGSILRTHVLRPTWHFVTPGDIRWLLELTAPRVNAANASMYRKLELVDALFRRSNEVIAGAVQGGQWRTREELGAELAASGIAVDKLRLGYIMMRAELDGIVCSGPRRGKQHTYALLDERAPHARSLPREVALAEITRRYYTGHGPATVQDFAWWSGLTMTDAKAGLEMVGSGLAQEVFDGQAYYFSAQASEDAAPVQAAFLLPTYDEFLVGYAAFGKSRISGQHSGQMARFDARVVLGGRVAGGWRRTFKKSAVVVEIAPFAPLARAEQQAVAAAARRYGDFAGMPVQCVMVE